MISFWCFSICLDCELLTLIRLVDFEQVNAGGEISKPFDYSIVISIFFIFHKKPLPGINNFLA